MDEPPRPLRYTTIPGSPLAASHPGWTSPGNGATFHLETPGGRKLPDPRAARILLVEDNPSDVELALNAFRKANLGNTIDVARDGVEALEYVLGVDGKGPANALPDLILLDLKLPRLNGLEVLARIRADARARHVIVVVLTSSGEQQDIVAGYRLGVNSYVRKPVDFRQFVTAIQQIGMYWLLRNRQPPLVLNQLG